MRNLKLAFRTLARSPFVTAVAILSLALGYWETNLGADPGVVGRTIVVNGQPLTIIGVAPKGFEGTTLGTRPRVNPMQALRYE